MLSTEAAFSASTGAIAGHEWVDLGLSVKWATCNVGATKPSDYGNYYAWGETSTKSDYFAENCATYGKETDDIAGTSRDVARVKWGGSWRMPTVAECVELLNKCTWTWTAQGGHNGYCVTGPNGNSIFLPAAGFCGESPYLVGLDGFYWSSTPYEGYYDYDYDAYGLSFASFSHSLDVFSRFRGFTVRLVTE